MYTYYDNAIARLLREIDEFEARGSGWKLGKVYNLELRINKYAPFRGSSYTVLIHKKKKKIKAESNYKCKKIIKMFYVVYFILFTSSRK